MPIYSEETFLNISILLYCVFLQYFNAIIMHAMKYVRVFVSRYILLTDRIEL